MSGEAPVMIGTGPDRSIARPLTRSQQAGCRGFSTRRWSSGSKAVTRRSRCEMSRPGPTWPWEPSTATSRPRITCLPRRWSIGSSSSTPAWRRSPPGATRPADRVIDVLDRALRAMGRQPRLVEAVFSSLSSSDPSTIDCQNQISKLMDGIISRAMGEPQPDDFADRSRLLGHVWYSSIVGWVNGRTDLARVHGEIAVAVRLLLGGGAPAERSGPGGST